MIDPKGKGIGKAHAKPGPEKETGLFARLPFLGLACYGPSALKAVARHHNAKIVIIDPAITRAWETALSN